MNTLKYLIVIMVVAAIAGVVIARTTDTLAQAAVGIVSYIFGMVVGWIAVSKLGRRKR